MRMKIYMSAFSDGSDTLPMRWLSGHEYKGSLQARRRFEVGRCKRSNSANDANKFAAKNKFGAHNVPEHMPQLTEIEEMLVASLHSHIQFNGSRE